MTLWLRRLLKRAPREDGAQTYARFLIAVDAHRIRYEASLYPEGSVEREVRLLFAEKLVENASKP